MRFIKTILICLAVVALQACATSSEISKIVKPSDIDQAAYFTPVALLGLIEEGNQAKYAQDISKQAVGNLTQLLEARKSNFPLTNCISPADSVLQMRISAEMVSMVQETLPRTRVYKTALRPLTDSVMDAHGQRFAVGLVQLGFIRAKGNYGKQLAKGVGVGLLTLGMYVPLPFKENSNVYAIVFDAHNNTVALFAGSTLTDRNPLDQELVGRQLNKVLNGLFYSRSSF